jgi:hypothetical protein
MQRRTETSLKIMSEMLGNPIGNEFLEKDLLRGICILLC